MMELILMLMKRDTAEPLGFFGSIEVDNAVLADLHGMGVDIQVGYCMKFLKILPDIIRAEKIIRDGSKKVSPETKRVFEWLMDAAVFAKKWPEEGTTVGYMDEDENEHMRKLTPEEADGEFCMIGVRQQGDDQ